MGESMNEERVISSVPREERSQLHEGTEEKRTDKQKMEMEVAGLKISREAQSRDIKELKESMGLLFDYLNITIKSGKYISKQE